MKKAIYLFIRTLVILLMVSGTAYAQVTSEDIENNTIRSSDIRNNSIRSIDIRNGTIESVDIKNHSITGADIKNGSITLNKVHSKLSNSIGASCSVGEQVYGIDSSGNLLCESSEGASQPSATIIDGNGNVLPIVNLSFDGTFGGGGSLRGGYVFDNDLLPISIYRSSANIFRGHDLNYLTTNCTGQAYIRVDDRDELLNRTIILSKQDQTSLYEGDRTSIVEVTILSYYTSGGCSEESQPSSHPRMPANVVGIFPFVAPYRLEYR